MSDVSHERWVLKKTARLAVAFATRAAMPKPATRPPVKPRLRALTYHRVGAVGRDPFCVSRKAFESHVRYLAEEGLAVSEDHQREFCAANRLSLHFHGRILR